MSDAARASVNVNLNPSLLANLAKTVGAPRSLTVTLSSLCSSPPRCRYVRSFLSGEENEPHLFELTELVRLLSLLQEVLAVNQRLLDSTQVRRVRGLRLGLVSLFILSLSA